MRPATGDNMSQAQGDNQPEPRREAVGGTRELRASQRIAVGTAARSLGEVVAKVASLVFYIALARELGQGGFGDFIFGMSLSAVLFIAAGLGLNELLARAVARDAGRVDELFWNIVGIRWLGLLVLPLIVAAIVAVKGYPAETGAAIVVISIGIGLDFQSNTLFALFQGLERNHHVATSLIVNRISTAAMVVAVLAAGGEILAAAAVFALGSFFGVATAYVLMRRYVVRPRFEIDLRGWPKLARAGLPLGFVGLLNQSILRLAVVMLGFLASSAAVGDYGAAYRLIEAMMFVPWAFGGAILPWFSRHTGEGIVSLARGYEMVTKTMVALLLPVALAFIIYAEPLIELLYGDQFDGAVTPLQLLGVMTVLVGLNSMATTISIGRDRPQDFTRPAAFVLVQNIAFSFVLIPAYGADGAALNLVISSALLFALTFRNLTRLVGAISPTRVVVAPLLSAAAMGGTAALLAGAPWVPAALAALVGYGAAFLLVERLLYPGDFTFYAGVLRLRREGIAPP
jgi:O-antigen/teichoic acid export membrane protein